MSGWVRSNKRNNDVIFLVSLVSIKDLDLESFFHEMLELYLQNSKLRFEGRDDTNIPELRVWEMFQDLSDKMDFMMTVITLHVLRFSLFMMYNKQRMLLKQ